nr:nicotinate-nucleotide--dimethylbenzimidazole phosphoribosyltransferase [Scopulibacillus darangshiensis]
MTIQKLDKQRGEEVRQYHQTLTKPQGSLGRLEELAVQLAEITGQVFPAVTPPGVIVFAADHGCTSEGVSAYPKEVTAQMVTNFLSGGAAINVLSRSIGAALKIVDIGVAADIDGIELSTRKIKRGTNNFCVEDAMTREEAIEALNIGREETEMMIRHDAIKCLITGEMGIGNTTSSSAIMAVLSGKPIETITGPGTGIDTEKIKHKQQVIKKAIRLRSPDPDDPIDVLAKIGGLEIGGMAGAMLAAAAHRIPILVDGFISTVAATLAERISPGAADYMIIGHLSTEPGHDLVIQMLGKMPLLDLGMRLGEGSGAALAFPLLEAATNILSGMATFDSAGVTNKE